MFLTKLAARCVFVHGIKFADALISKVLWSRDLVGILLEVVRLFDLKSSATSKPFNRNDVSPDAMCKLLLQHFRCSSCVRETLQENRAIFRRCSASAIVPLLVHLLADADLLFVSLDVGTLMRALLEVLNRHLDTDGTPSLQFLIQALRDVPPDRISPSNNNAIENLCSKVGRHWRKSLLFGLEVSESGFGKALSLIGQELLRTPTDLIPLSLFGFVAGQELDVVHASSEMIPRVVITLAVIKVLQLALDSMTLSKDVIFHRIAPLLLLRRMPGYLFRLAMNDATVASRELPSLLFSVGKQLASRLDISEPGNGTSVHFVAEERRLAAEIAGRLLPLGELFGDYNGTTCASCYRLICYPALKDLVECLRASDPHTELLIRRIRSGRAALFVACTAVPIADDTDNGDCLLGIVRFVIELMSVEREHIAATVADDFQQLQTGCVEFFAVCAKRKLISQETARDSCAAIDPQSTLLVTDRRNSSLRYVLGETWKAVEDILQTGGSRAEWMPSNSVVVELVRTRLWSSLLLVCQRCDEGQLHYLASCNLPWIVAWLTGGPLSTCPMHPLCVAAAMQTAFVLLMRTKSLEFVAHSMTSRQRASQALFRFVVNSLKTQLTILPVRLAALTLLLAIVSVDSVSTEVESVAYLRPSDVLETFAIVRDLTISDDDAQIQQISTRILCILSPH